MPLPSQFSLSLELTKFIPAASIVNATLQAAINIARELQKSGSNIVVEEDLAVVFGRTRILPRFESSFKTAVKESGYQQFSEFLDIVLADGAGPTVRRSLQDPRYFSTVVQLSLLAWSHDTDTLSASLAVACERRVRGAPPEQQHFPTSNGIAGTLQQCRDQTAHFQWIHLFRAVEEELGLDKDARRLSRKLPFVVLQGAMDFFLAVQTFPEDRIVHIVAHEGYCTIVVWAYHLLGLNVTVHIQDETVKFGHGRGQVILECQPGSQETTSICLLTADGSEEVFKIASDTEWCPDLNDDFRVPAEGYGRSVLEAYVGTDEPVCRDLAHITVANSWDAAVEFSEEFSTHPRNLRAPRAFRRLSCCSRKRLFEVGCFLFGDSSLSLDAVRRIANQMSPEPTSSGFEPLEFQIQSSEAIREWQKRWYPDEMPIASSEASAKSERLAELVQVISELSCVLFSFSAVSNLSECKQLPLCRGSGSDVWTGRLGLYPFTDHSSPSYDLCEPYELYNILARLLLGVEYDGYKLRKASLVSSWGWSVYLPTIGAIDPAPIQPDSIRISRGVPVRYEERKSWIIDGSNSKTDIGLHPYLEVGHPGDLVALRCMNITKKPRLFVGSSGSAFEASIEFVGTRQLSGNAGHKSTSMMIGYRRLAAIRWGVELLRDCQHRPRSDEELNLPENTYAFTGYGPGTQSAPKAVYAGLTAKDPTARWLLMEGTFSHRKRSSRWSKHNGRPLLRGETCCFACAVKHAHVTLEQTGLPQLLIL
ncbi:MAG: hypothetical protein M1830_010257 [Pleopsidium flavum]|nr:MAG: hypothetical protein M1830_010257 [Pleopsidium flavum]